MPDYTIQTTPPHDILDKAVAEYLPRGGLSDELKAAMAVATRVLEGHPVNARRIAEGKLPANGVWFWGEGQAIELPSFTARYSTGGVVSAVPLVKGIARLAGLEAPEVPGANGELETNYPGKVAATLDALKSADFAAVHLEAPDECSHAGDAQGKLKAIEYLSERLVKPLVEGMNKSGEAYRLLLLSDHATPLSTRTHADDPVPYLIYDSRVSAAGTANAYDEDEAKKGEFIEEGDTLMEILFRGFGAS